MRSKLKTAVIGVGNIGKSHARIYSEISNLVAVCDLNEKLGSELADTFSCKYYKSYQEMLETEKPDAVSIAVPTSLHNKIAVEILGKKIPVLLEKPISDSLKNAREILEVSNKNKTPLMIGHLERFNPAVRKAKQLIESGKLGKIVNIIARRVGGFPPQIKDVNIAVDLAIHDLDIVNFLMNEDPQKITVNKRKNHLMTREDSVEFFVLYKNASAFIQSNWVTPVKIRKLNITGTEGYLELDYINQTVNFYKSIYEKLKDVDAKFEDFILKFKETNVQEMKIIKAEPLKEEIKHFLKAVENNSKIDSEHAYKALEMALS